MPTLEQALAICPPGIQRLIPIDPQVNPARGNPKGKKPYIRWKQWQTDSPTREQMQRWERQFPGCNWGVPLHAHEFVAETDSIDADEHWNTFARELGLQHFRKVLSGSGRGHHYYYRTAVPLAKIGKFDKRVEVKTRGNFVVAPPSVHLSGGVYTVIEDHPDASVLSTEETAAVRDRVHGKKPSERCIKPNRLRDVPIVDPTFPALSTVPKFDRSSHEFRIVCDMVRNELSFEEVEQIWMLGHAGTPRFNELRDTCGPDTASEALRYMYGIALESVSEREKDAAPLVELHNLLLAYKPFSWDVGEITVLRTVLQLLIVRGSHIRTPGFLHSETAISARDLQSSLTWSHSWMRLKKIVREGGQKLHDLGIAIHLKIGKQGGSDPSRISLTITLQEEPAEGSHTRESSTSDPPHPCRCAIVLRKTGDALFLRNGLGQGARLVLSAFRYGVESFSRQKLSNMTNLKPWQVSEITARLVNQGILSREKRGRESWFSLNRLPRPSPSGDWTSVETWEAVMLEVAERGRAILAKRAARVELERAVHARFLAKRLATAKLLPSKERASLEGYVDWARRRGLLDEAA